MTATNLNSTAPQSPPATGTSGHGAASPPRSPAPVSVLIPTRNEGRNLARCLAAVAGWADEVVVVDSNSQDETVAIAESYGARVVQFNYTGGWPKKRQWALDSQAWSNDWILLLDADEILTERARREIESAIRNGHKDGYWLRFQIVFLGRTLRFGDTTLWKLSLFRRGKGRYEQRLAEQDASMGDIEIHEHVIVDGEVGRLASPIRHENVNSLDRYISKHNEYSNWEAGVLSARAAGELRPALLGNQAQRRRWLKMRLVALPGSPLCRFLYLYLCRLGFLDGRAGFSYAVFKGIQLFHVKAKMHELRQNRLAADKHRADRRE